MKREEIYKCDFCGVSLAEENYYFVFKTEHFHSHIRLCVDNENCADYRQCENCAISQKNKTKEWDKLKRNI